MGAIADAIVAFAQPLIDQTDGSPDQLNNAFGLAQLCWNLALLPEEGRDGAIVEMRQTLKMNEDEFEALRRSIIVPMIHRHHEMFPHMHRQGSMKPSRKAFASQNRPKMPVRTEKYPGTGRNAPCPCNSGRKYKRCCGK
jgi:hypothetical protein